ncbi:hypothetical protein F5Y05DRAFT_413536 [Hypoxylon sp. FL0543]|nr:hypothetical protein F5Y05DRAFT_413536 [Hypoxylon sp. FL0543]
MASSQGKPGPGDPGPEGPSQPQEPLNCGKHLASRSPLFSDLGEAIRKIRYKGESSDDLSQKRLREIDSNRDKLEKLLSPPSEDEPTGETITQSQDAEPHTSIVGRSLTDAYGDSPNYTQPKNSDMHFSEQEAEESSAVEPLSASMNTVADIVGHYAGYPTTGTSVPPRDGVATRLGFRGEETNRNGVTLRHDTPGSPPLDLPQDPYLKTPLHRRRSRSMLEFSRGSSPFAGTTVSDSQHLLDADAQANELQQTRKPFFPSPLRLPEKVVRNQARLEDNDEFFGGATSANDVTTDSSVNPFKYDNQHYKASYKFTKEREVSRGLKRVSNIGDSGVLRFTPEASAYDVGYRGLQRPSNNAYPAEPDRKAFEIKVVIGNRAKLDAQEDGDIGMADRSTRDARPGSLLQESLPKESTGDGDWVTESSGEDDTEHTEETQRPDDLQMRGNTAADHADGGQKKSPGAWGPGFRAIKHPAGKDTTESYELRELRGSKQKVFLPKGRPLAGPANALRVFPSSQSASSQVWPPMSRGLSNPFGANDNYRRADPAGNFSKTSNRFAKSRYEFRDSVSEYGFAIPHSKTQANLVGVLEDGDSIIGSPPPSLQRDRTSSQQVEVTSERGYQPRLVDKDYPVRKAAWWHAEREEAKAAASSSKSQGAKAGEGNLFSFDLLSIDEAQRRKKAEKAAESAGTIVPPRLSLNLSASLGEICRDALNQMSFPFSTSSPPISSQADRSLLSRPSAVSAAPAAIPAERKGLFERLKCRMPFISRNQGQRDVSEGTVVQHPVAEAPAARQPVVYQSDLSLAAMEEIIEPGISEAGHKRRRQWYCFMMILGAVFFPIVTAPLMGGKLDFTLVWYTNGEIHKLTIRQKNAMRNLFLAEFGVSVVLLSCLLAVYGRYR